MSISHTQPAPVNGYLPLQDASMSKKLARIADDNEHEILMNLKLTLGLTLLVL